jgi:hypothetical protein
VAARRAPLNDGCPANNCHWLRPDFVVAFFVDATTIHPPCRPDTRPFHKPRPLLPISIQLFPAPLFISYFEGVKRIA